MHVYPKFWSLDAQKASVVPGTVNNYWLSISYFGTSSYTVQNYEFMLSTIGFTSVTCRSTL